MDSKVSENNGVEGREAKGDREPFDITVGEHEPGGGSVAVKVD
jgi:hypothetical protein